nr:phosphopantetheine-binding protein [Myxococcus sp. AM010]
MPGTPLQRSLVELWQEMLGVAPIGIQDNFFELGGDSLIAVQLSGRIKKQLGLDLPASSLYEGVTVEALSALLKPAEAEGQERREAAPAADASLQRRKQTLARQRDLRRFDDDDDV